MPDPLNLVNDLRLVLNTHLGTSYPMLPQREPCRGQLPDQFETLNVG